VGANLRTTLACLSNDHERLDEGTLVVTLALTPAALLA
jgi:hypothetical protein